MLCLVGNMDWLDEKKEMTVNRQGGWVGLAADLAEIFDSKFVSKEHSLLSPHFPSRLYLWRRSLAGGEKYLTGQLCMHCWPPQCGPLAQRQGVQAIATMS